MEMQMFWRTPKWYCLSPDDGAGTGGGAPESAENAAGGENGNPENGGDETGKSGDDLAAELAKLKAEMVKQKAALDAATSEAGKYKKELRAKQTAEEIAAEEKKAADEQTAQEIENLRKEVARAKTIKTVMSKLGTDEDSSGKIADYLYGAEDPEAALGELQKVWLAREKALKLEYGKVPPPGVGGNGQDSAEAAAVKRAAEIGKARAEADKHARDAMSAYLR